MPIKPFRQLLNKMPAHRRRRIARRVRETLAAMPLEEDVQAYFDREVKPHVLDAWIDENKTKVGYEIPLTRHFYKYTPPRPLEL